MMKGGGALFGSSDGNAAVEAAIVLPILLFVAIGLIFIPLSMLYSKIILIDAAREGARYVAIYNDEDGARDLIEQVVADGGLAPERIAKPDASEEPISFMDTGGDSRYVTVTITYLQPVLFPQIVKLVGNNNESLGEFYVLQAKSTFKKEWVSP